MVLAGLVASHVFLRAFSWAGRKDRCNPGTSVRVHSGPLCPCWGLVSTLYRPRYGRHPRRTSAGGHSTHRRLKHRCDPPLVGQTGPASASLSPPTLLLALAGPDAGPHVSTSCSCHRPHRFFCSEPRAEPGQAPGWGLTGVLSLPRCRLCVPGCCRVFPGLPSCPHRVGGGRRVPTCGAGSLSMEAFLGRALTPPLRMSSLL